MNKTNSVKIQGLSLSFGLICKNYTRDFFLSRKYGCMKLKRLVIKLDAYFVEQTKCTLGWVKNIKNHIIIWLRCFLLYNFVLSNFRFLNFLIRGHLPSQNCTFIFTREYTQKYKGKYWNFSFLNFRKDKFLHNDFGYLRSIVLINTVLMISILPYVMTL